MELKKKKNSSDNLTLNDCVQNFFVLTLNCLAPTRAQCCLRKWKTACKLTWHKNTSSGPTWTIKSDLKMHQCHYIR